MVAGDDRSGRVRIAELEAQVQRLEKSLAERSDLIRALSPELCDKDLVTLSRLSSGLPPLPRSGIGLAGWRESTELSPADVEETMIELWRSLAVAKQRAMNSVS
jgi:hypothetical protein